MFFERFDAEIGREHVSKFAFVEKRVRDAFLFAVRRRKSIRPERITLPEPRIAN